MDFFYDADGNPYALRVYSTSDLASYGTYYYICNAQGDVVKIVHQSGTVKAECTYDAWGKIRSATGDLAASNPLRYRGYYYDTETGWYYLQSRYYDPIVKRFLNADVFASTGQGFIGCNMFAYCNNCPIIYSDPSGMRQYSAEQIARAQQTAWNIGQNATIDDDGIHLSSKKFHTAIAEIIKVLGKKKTYSIIAISSCAKFKRETGNEFILSDECVAYEIQQHVEAYRWATGASFFGNALGYGYSLLKGKTAVVTATETTDIRISDVKRSATSYEYGNVVSQADLFGYMDGIRSCYVGTQEDPWANYRPIEDYIPEIPVD